MCIRCNQEQCTIQNWRKLESTCLTLGGGGGTYLTRQHFYLHPTPSHAKNCNYNNNWQLLYTQGIKNNPLQHTITEYIVIEYSPPHWQWLFSCQQRKNCQSPITINVVLDDKVMGSCYASVFFRLLCLQSKRPFLTFCLCVKMSLGVKLFICKRATYTFIFIWIKLYFMWKVLQEDSLWSSQSITYKCNLFQRP